MKKFLSRDYFGRPDSSLSCSFSPQGLFQPAGFIFILLFCATGIISASQIHLYLAPFLHRDYFGRPDSSLSCSFLHRDYFAPDRCISILLFFLRRDYFGQPDSSLSCSFSPQGLFRPARIHLYLALFLHRDYFGQPDSSLSCSFAPQGLFRPAGFIPILLFFSTGIISAGRIHLYLALFLHRDYFSRPDASLSCSLSPQGLFRPAGFIPILRFFTAGITWPRSDASLSGFSAPHGLFRPDQIRPIVENISARPFRQLPICLIMK